MLGVVSEHDANPRLFELGGGLGLLDVAAADLVAAGEEDASERRHASPARAHQVNSHVRLTTS